MANRCDIWERAEDRVVDESRVNAAAEVEDAAAMHLTVMDR
jgi:hypothetical protein